MPEMAQKILLFSVGLLFTVSLIFIGVRIYQKAVKTSNAIEYKQARELAEMEESDIMKYDGLEIPGSTVITYIKRIYEDTEVSVTTKLLNGTKKTFTVDASQFSAYKDASSGFYINPLDMYYVSVTRNANDVIGKVQITNTIYN